VNSDFREPLCSEYPGAWFEFVLLGPMMFGETVRTRRESGDL